MTSPTIGYLLAYLPAAALVGFLADRGWGTSVLSSLGMMAAGSALILLCGASWLSVMIGPQKALAFGVMPFLAGDLLKLALASAILPLAWKLVRR